MSDLDTLMRFYNVETTADLIEAMAKHIEKIQTKVRSLERAELARSVMREG